jgi:uncharacterized protein with von Willebrand factor type A (vWA) domain
MLDRVLGFTHALREAGIPVAVSETMDALRAAEHVDLLDRTAFKAALAATTIKSDSQRDAFDVIFDLYFADIAPADAARPGSPPSADAFMAELAAALQGGDSAALGGLAERAVEAFGRVENSPSGSLYFEYPVFRAIDLNIVLGRATQGDGDLPPLEARLRREGVERRIRDFRGLVQRGVRGRVAARKGPDYVASYAVRPVLEDVDISTATLDELERIRQAIRPLARRLATRAALKQRRSSRGRLDVRRTVRHSLSTGGVPFDTFLKKRAPHRPELFLLCDVSDSVARFARFSLMLIHALHSEFSKVRSFAFIDTVDEVTHLFEQEDFGLALERLNTEAEVVWLDRNSNYGTALERFEERFAADLGPKTTLLILGDARSNNRNPREWALKEIAGRAHRTFWLNPESIVYWDTGDSVATRYAAFTDGMVEVRTLRQLEDFVATVL